MDSGERNDLMKYKSGSEREKKKICSLSLGIFPTSSLPSKAGGGEYNPFMVTAFL